MKNRIEQTLNNIQAQGAGENSGASSAESGTQERDRAEAFLAFHAQNHHRLSAFVHLLVPSWQDAEEIVQDTLVVLWQKFEDFDPATSFFSWAARVAQYEVLNYRRSKRRHALVLDSNILEAVAATAMEQLDDLQFHREALEHCIKKLAERDREIVRLRYQEGANIHSTAESVGRTTGHIQRMLRKIRAGLLRCIHLKLSELGS